MPAIGQAMGMGGGVIGSAVIRVAADTSNLISGVKASTSALRKMAMTGTLIYAIATAVKAITSEFIAFDKAMHNTWTLIDGTEKKMQSLGKQTRAMAREFNVGSTEAQQSLYQIYSAVFYGKDAFNILEQSIKGAAAGLASLFSTVDMITTVLNAYSLAAGEAAHVNDLLFTAIKFGKCVRKGTLVFLPDGRLEKVENLCGVESVVSLSGNSFEAAKAGWVEQGIKRIVRVETRLGRRIDTTWSHPYLTENGWEKVLDLSVGDKIAVPTHLPFFGNVDVSKEEAGFIGFWVAEGSGGSYVPQVTTQKYGDQVRMWASSFNCVAKLSGPKTNSHYNISYNTKDNPNYVSRRDNPCMSILKKYKIQEDRSAHKHIPDEVFTWKKEHVSEFLHWLFNGDGWLCRGEDNGYGYNHKLGFGSKSEKLVRQVSHLLLRFGIVGRVRERHYSKAIMDSMVNSNDGNFWTWETAKSRDIRRFVRDIGIDREFADEAANKPFEERRDRSNARISSKDIDDMKLLWETGKYTQIVLGERFGVCQQYVSDIVNGVRRGPGIFSEDLSIDIDYKFDSIVSIEEIGEDYVYDLVVPGLQNFVAEDIIAHNTTLPELASQFGRLAGVAAPVGASISDMTAAIATLTRQGIRTDWAITSLRQTLMQFIKPVKNLKMAIKDLGYSSGTAIIKHLGFAKALKLVTKWGKDNNVEMSEMFTNVRAITAVLPLATTAAAGFSKDLERMAGSSGAATEAFNKQTESMSYKLEVITTYIKDFAITLGETLVNALYSVMIILKEVTSILRPLLDIFNKLGGATMVGMAATTFIAAKAFKALGVSLTFVKKQMHALAVSGLVKKLVAATTASNVATASMWGPSQINNSRNIANVSRLANGQFAGYRMGAYAQPTLEAGDASRNAAIGQSFLKKLALTPKKLGLALGGLVVGATALVNLNVELGKVDGLQSTATKIWTSVGSILGFAGSGAALAGLPGAIAGGIIGMGAVLTLNVYHSVKDLNDDKNEIKAQMAGILSLSDLPERFVPARINVDAATTQMQSEQLVSGMLEARAAVGEEAFKQILYSITGSSSREAALNPQTSIDVNQIADANRVAELTEPLDENSAVMADWIDNWFAVNTQFVQSKENMALLSDVLMGLFTTTSRGIHQMYSDISLAEDALRGTGMTGLIPTERGAVLSQDYIDTISDSKNPEINGVSSLNFSIDRMNSNMDLFSRMARTEYDVPEEAWSSIADLVGNVQTFLETPETSAGKAASDWLAEFAEQFSSLPTDDMSAFIWSIITDLPADLPEDNMKEIAIKIAELFGSSVEDVYKLALAAGAPGGVNPEVPDPVTFEDNIADSIESMNKWNESIRSGTNAVDADIDTHDDMISTYNKYKNLLEIKKKGEDANSARVKAQIVQLEEFIDEWAWLEDVISQTETAIQKLAAAFLGIDTSNLVASLATFKLSLGTNVQTAVAQDNPGGIIDAAMMISNYRDNMQQFLDALIYLRDQGIVPLGEATRDVIDKMIVDAEKEIGTSDFTEFLNQYAKGVTSFIKGVTPLLISMPAVSKELDKLGSYAGVATTAIYGFADLVNTVIGAALDDDVDFGEVVTGSLIGTAVNIGLAFISGFIEELQRQAQARIDAAQLKIERMYDAMENFSNMVSDAAAALLNFANASDHAARIQDGMSTIIAALATSLFGFLAPFSAIIGAITMQMSKLNVEVAEEVETKKELNDLNLPIGWKVDRIRYKASMPGQPPILDEESSTTAKDDLETEYKWLTELLNGAGSGITEFANTIMAFIGEIGAAWETIYPQIFGLIDAVLETMMAGLRPLKDWIIAELIPSIGNLAEGFTKFWKDQIDPFLRDKVFPKIAEWGLKLYSFFKDKFVPFLETKLWPFISGPLWDMFSTAIDNVIIALTGLFDALVYYWDVVETVLLNALDQWVSQMFGFTEGLTIGMAVLNEFNAAMGEQGSSLDAFYDKMWGLGHSVEEVNRAMMLMAQDPSWSGIHAAADSLGMDVYDLSDLFRSMGIDITALAQRLNEAKDTIPDFTVNENTPPPGGGTSGGENPGGGSGDGTLWGGLARIGYMTSGGSSMTFKDLFMAAGFSAGAAQATYTSLKGNGMSEYDVFQYINSRYVPNLDIGGSVTSSGIASVKQGEVWYNPAVGRPYGMDNNGMIVNTAVYMNGEEIVRQTDNYKSGQNALTSGTALPGGL